MARMEIRVADTDPTLPDLRRRLKRWSDRDDAGAGAEYVIADPAGDRPLGAVNLLVDVVALGLLADEWR